MMPPPTSGAPGSSAASSAASRSRSRPAAPADESAGVEEETARRLAAMSVREIEDARAALTARLKPESLAFLKVAARRNPAPEPRRGRGRGLRQTRRLHPVRRPLHPVRRPLQLGPSPPPPGPSPPPPSPSPPASPSRGRSSPKRASSSPVVALVSLRYVRVPSIVRGGSRARRRRRRQLHRLRPHAHGGAFGSICSRRRASPRRRPSGGATRGESPGFGDGARFPPRGPSGRAGRTRIHPRRGARPRAEFRSRRSASPVSASSRRF